MPAPLINPLRVNGGTFYTFTSATNDLTSSQGDADRKFTFSKFVCLDLPDVATPSSNGENYVVWEAIGSVLAGGTSSVPQLHSDENLNFAESFQNYVLNFEQLVLSGRNSLAQDYDTSEDRTVSERIFWKWLANVNAMRWRSASASESAVANGIVEADPTSYYKRVVKYLGDIDIVNNVRSNGQAYQECYIHIPTSHGSTPVILWKSVQDNNYAPGRSWSNGNVYIDGRDSGSVHPSGLDLRAYYDNDITDQYVSQTAFGDITNVGGSAILGSPKPVIISKLDGAILDFDPNSYAPIVADPNVSILAEFNMSDAASNFSFNAVLIYYDIYSESDQSNRSTNLYGILILDDYVNQGSGLSYLKRYDKFKPNAITKLNGNAYGLKLDLKYDTSIDNAAVETVINEFNTFSMDLYADAMIRLQECADLFMDMSAKFAVLEDKILTLEQIYFTSDDLAQLRRDLESLQLSLENSRAALSSSSSYTDIANRLADRLDLIISGRTSLNIVPDLSLFQNGSGIGIRTLSTGALQVYNKSQEFSTFMLCSNTSNFLQTTFGNGKTLASLVDANKLTLGEFSNYFKQKNTNTDPIENAELFGDDLYINVDDTNVKWSKGQSMKIYFEGPISSEGNKIALFTDAPNAFGLGTFGKQIGEIYDYQISEAPIIEIICKDPSTYTFDINILK